QANEFWSPHITALSIVVPLSVAFHPPVGVEPGPEVPGVPTSSTFPFESRTCAPTVKYCVFGIHTGGGLPGGGPVFVHVSPSIVVPLPGRSLDVNGGAVGPGPEMPVVLVASHRCEFVSPTVAPAA